MTQQSLVLAPPSQTVRYDEMCKAIALAYSVDEAKHIRDKAMAIQVYARQAGNTEAERQACEIRLRAERKAGELVSVMEKAKGGKPPKNPSPTGRSSSKETLADVGITYRQSSNWQKLAAVPEPVFEAALAMPKPTTSSIIAATTPKKVSPVDPMALWLWGRLQDFGREGLLAADPNRLIATMLPHMQATTRACVPDVIAWLRRIV